ncbi:MAG: flavodoxin family protein [Desulfobacterota bacterium]|nr:flavodoxin family protein [Thermodesulfobacteriota bacterium]
MKVFAFVGSPRKRGNSDILADAFLEGAAAAGGQVEKFFLADLNINQCKGCFRNCMTKPGMQCAVYRDDMDMLLEKIASADLMLFVSPLYCATYSAIMARFFERCLPLWEVEIVGELGTMDALRFINNPAKGKKAVIALVQDLRDARAGELAFKAYEHNLGSTYMMEIVGRIHVTDVRDIGDIAKKKDRLDEIRALGKKLVTG